MFVTDINYDGKFFIPEYNSETGEVGNGTEFEYHQEGSILWANYSGGDIVRGTIIGTVSQNGELDFHYQHINKNNEIRIGKCKTTPSIMNNGKIKLAEEWQWLNGDLSKGTSVLVEK